MIETSGLALPKPLLKAFDWPAIRSRLTVDGVVAVVDGRAVAEGRFATTEARARARGRHASTTTIRSRRSSRTSWPALISSSQ